MVPEISKQRDIPKSFLSKILQKLARAGIVESTRGIRGGFRLTRHPSEITLLEVVEAVEGNVAMNICAVDRRKCRLSGTCSVHPVWVELRKIVEDKLRKLDFEQLSGMK